MCRLCFWIICDLFLTNSASEKFCEYGFLQYGKKATVRMTRHKRSTGIKLCYKTSFKMPWQFHTLSFQHWWYIWTAMKWFGFPCTDQNQWDFLFLSLKCRAEPKGSVWYALHAGCDSMIILIWGVGKQNTCLITKKNLF